jgi:uncharacterized membrane protein YkoI
MDKMRTFKRTIALTLAACALGVVAVKAQQTGRHKAHKETAAELKAEAKITEDAARATALADVPNGKVESAELEREHGHLLYSFDIKVDSKPGLEEVHVDAITGKLLSRKHETAAHERAEMRKEAKAKTTKPPKKPNEP